MKSALEAKVRAYKPADSAIKLIRSTPILFLVGPTGAGKDSVKALLLKSNKYHHIVSHTIRPPRINHGVKEVDGQDYYFINESEAIKMLDTQAFIEAKIYSGNLYGTSAMEIKSANDKGKIAMTDIEVRGVAEYKRIDPNVMAVFLLPPDFKIWQQRLSRRYGDVVDAMDHRARLQTALDEIEELLTTDYYIPVVNNDLSETYKEVNSIVDHDSKYPLSVTKAKAVAKTLAKDIENYLSQA